MPVLALLAACSGPATDRTSPPGESAVAPGDSSGDSPWASHDSARESPPDEECDTAVPDPVTPDIEALCAFEGTPAVLAADGFDREASWDLGTTEVGGRPWIPSGEAGSGYASLTGDALQLHYFLGGPSVPDQWVDVGRTAVADVVIDARLKTYSEYYAGLFGLSYRLPTQDGLWRNGGYHVLLESGVLTLYAGQVALDSVELGDDHDWHAWRVVANGDAHCVWVDDVLVLQAQDDTWLRPGYVGAAAYYSIGHVDDVSIAEHPSPRGTLLPGFDAVEQGPIGAVDLDAEGTTYEVAVTADSGTVTLPSGAVVPLASDGASDWRILQTAHTLRTLQDGVEVASVPSPGQAGTVSLVGELRDIGLRELDPDAVYPTGGVEGVGRFPIVLYSVGSGQLGEALSHGGNVVHRYDHGDSYASYAEGAAVEGVAVLGNLGSYYVDDADPQPNTRQAEVEQDIAALGHRAAWWTYPEELRYWRDNELAELANLTDWTRASWPKPTFMYQAGHYTAEALAESVPYVDVVGKGSYVVYAEQPRAWVRHQLDSTLEGIALAGRTVGPDWEAGQRTPIVIVGLWGDSPASAAELRHDVWSGIASGARGVALFSYAYVHDEASGDGLAGFAQAAGEIEAGLGDAVLYGDAIELSFEITAGPAETVEFEPTGVEPLAYPCLNVAGWDHDGVRTVVAVNSCEEPLTASVSGLSGVDAEVVSEGRVLCVEEGVVVDDFDALGVHLYRMEAP